MANVLVVPASGSIIFDSQTAGSSTISPLSTAPRISYDNAGGINIQSYVTATSALDRFTVDGTNGRLFSVSDALTGSIFSVNDISGLPIIEVNSGVTDVITMGTYGTNALVVSGGSVAIGTATPGSAKLTVAGTVSGLSFSSSETTAGASALLMQENTYVRWLGGAAQWIRGWSGRISFGSGPSGIGTEWGRWSGNDLRITGTCWLGIGTDTGQVGTVADANNILAQRNGATPQESRIYSTYTDAANYERFFIKTNVGATSATQIGLSAGGSGQNRNLEFVAGGSTRMTITSAGNVGVGTTTPSSLFDIHDGSALQKNVTLTLRNGNYGWWQITSSNTNNAGFLRFFSNNSSQTPLVLDGTTGNVGIGNSATPSQKLTVSGNISASGTIYSAGSAVVVSPTIVSIQAVTSSQYSALVSAGQALSSVLYLVQDP